VCDTLCLLGDRRTIFAKNSDRPLTEVQLVGAFGRRPAGGPLRTQYLELADTGAAATLLARPTWLWGAEHGVNEHRVAIGNEKVATTADVGAAPPGLIGMDLVRLGLERATSADEALDVMTALLGEFGQGGIADATFDEAYCSSFLVVDPAGAWVLETAGRTWVAEPVHTGAAISNRLSLRRGWTRSSADVQPGQDFDEWRDPEEPTGYADLRLAASQALLASAVPDRLGAAALVGHLRDHGHGPWGSPGAADSPQAPPPELLADFTGISVCMHVRGYMATTSSIVAELPSEATAPLRAWVAPGSPCVSVYLPVFPAEPDGVGSGASLVPDALSDEGLWHRLATLRLRAEEDPEAIVAIRRVLGPIEAELWAEADAVADEPGRWPDLARQWSTRFGHAVGRLVGR